MTGDVARSQMPNGLRRPAAMLHRPTGPATATPLRRGHPRLRCPWPVRLFPCHGRQGCLVSGL